MEASFAIELNPFSSKVLLHYAWPTTAFSNTNRIRRMPPSCSAHSKTQVGNPAESRDRPAREIEGCFVSGAICARAPIDA